MAKIATKFIAQLTIKLNRVLVPLKIEVDLDGATQEGTFENLLMQLQELAAEDLAALIDGVCFKLTNKADLKRAFKAYEKANPLS